MGDDSKICAKCLASNKLGARQCWICSAPFAAAPPAPSGAGEGWTLGCLLVAVLVASYVIHCFSALNNIR